MLSEDQLTEASKLLLRLAVTSGVDGALFTQAALPAESKAGGTRCGGESQRGQGGFFNPSFNFPTSFCA